jgi:hypothetical protein
MFYFLRQRSCRQPLEEERIKCNVLGCVKSSVGFLFRWDRGRESLTRVRIGGRTPAYAHDTGTRARTHMPDTRALARDNDAEILESFDLSIIQLIEITGLDISKCLM